MVKELFKNECFTFNEWCKVYLYNDWLNHCFPNMGNSEKKYIIYKHAITNKLELYRP